jgi:hypothetical protein
VTENLEEIQVRNRGAAAVFSLINARMKGAMMTINTIIAIASQRHGQSSGGAISDSRSKHINGWAEALNDGVTSSWDGNEFVTYGGQSRTDSSVDSALNSIPQWLGTAGGATADISYSALENGYQDASFGQVSPDIGVTSKRGIARIKNRLQAQQIFRQETDPMYGFEGIRFNRAFIMKDDYWPSAANGVNDAKLGNT